MIRCDDIFVDSSPNQFERICQIVKRYDFEHLIGITPLGEGKKLWARDSTGLLKVPLSTFFANYRVRRMTGEKFIGNNVQLIEILNAQFSEHGAIPALHGYHHYNYDRLPQKKVYKELSTGIELLEALFNVRVKIFSPPFNAWNRTTELVCESLDLSLDKCLTGFDVSINNMNSSQIKRLAEEQSSTPEVHYHPYRILDLEKFELYLKTRREYRQF